MHGECFSLVATVIAKRNEDMMRDIAMVEAIASRYKGLPAARLPTYEVARHGVNAAVARQEDSCELVAGLLVISST